MISNRELKAGEILTQNDICWKNPGTGIMPKDSKLVLNREICIDIPKDTLIKLDFLTKKDLHAIEIAKKMNIRNFALSFTNNVEDIERFKKILPTQTKIYKIESKHAVQTFNKLIKIGDNFLIDRGDLSKEMSIENIPYIQRKILKKSKEFKNKKIYIATNFLESMIINKFPTRGEANDIYSSLEMGARGIVLAAETAIGNYPEESIIFLKKMMFAYKKNLN